ncbi:MAG TPA: coproporphyrinogen III oxidase [Elusimicrobia bacterium]|nr:coproporphyrinogen III oxidase [Elusimicrobiota bacterium]
MFADPCRDRRGQEHDHHLPCPGRRDLDVHEEELTEAGLADISGPLGLYVHVPFCSGKCGYCDFTSFPGQGHAVFRYLEALKAEARLVNPGRDPETLYVGGGTPSELSAGEIAQLFAALHVSFPAAKFIETTFEVNPESVNEEKLGVLRLAGVTRLSLGLQALDDDVLKAVGRRHTARDSLRAFAAARKAGGWSISLDIICGLPGQSRDGFLEGLARVLELGPDHLSIYGLDLHDGTPLARSGYAADEDLGRDMLEAAMDRVEAAGLAHYEISNFARPGHESRHNLNYWKGGEYIGLGCAAASYLDGVRSRNVADLETYFDCLRQGKRPLAESERLSGVEKSGEAAMLGLRLVRGFEPSPDVARQFDSKIRGLIERSLLRREQGKLQLTREGIFLANQVFMEFVPPFEESNI